MKALVLVVFAFALAVSGRAAAEECAGIWSVSVLDKQTRETKLWCPEDGEFEFRIPAWKETVCTFGEILVKADNPNSPTHRRWLMCTARSVTVAQALVWHPVSRQSEDAFFTIKDEKTGREFFVQAAHSTR
jgi:hypothetical protein